jgi:hypothetical protein
VSEDSIYPPLRLSLIVIYHMIQMTTPIELVGQHVQVSLDDCLCSLAGSSTCNVFIGRHGLALSLITEFDIDRIHAIEDQRSE